VVKPPRLSLRAWAATPVEVQRAHHALDPVIQALRGRGASKDATGGGHGRDKDLGARAIVYGHRGAREVDEQLLAGTSVLAHRAFEGLGEVLVVTAELGVAPGTTMGMGLHVLLPQQHERDALAVEFTVDAAPVGGDVGLRGVRLGQQGGGQSLLAPALHHLPVQACGMAQANILGHGPFGDVEGGGDLLVRELGLPLQADNVFDHA
jgi:hypothetical protein